MDSSLELFQRRCHELEEANVQTKILLESSQADKNHISRVMQQNEKLKNEFQELQLQLARVVSISLLSLLGFGPSDYQEDTLYFLNKPFSNCFD